MKKFILTFIAVCCCLFMMGCVSVTEKTVTFTVPDENVNFFTPESLDAFFSRYRFASNHKYIYKTKIDWCFSWYRGNRKWYISAEIHQENPDKLIFTGYEFDGSQFNEMISDFSSFLSQKKVKFQINSRSRNVKEISIFLRNQSAMPNREAAEIEYFKREKTGGEK